MEKKFIPYGLHEIGEDDIEAVAEALRSDWITGGPKIAEFEKAFCDYIGCKNTVAVCNGTAALDIAVQSLGLPKDSEIITTPFTFVASSNAVLYNDCKPVFADIEKEARNIDASSVRKKITKKTRAILFVDYAGHPSNIKELAELAEEHDLYLIEDACHALGAEYGGRKVGNFADLSIFSFHPVKHITTGEGGAVATDDEELHERMMLLRNHGIDRDAGKRAGKDSSYVYDMKMLGRNYRITDFQCALGLSQLKKLPGFIQRRRHLVGIYESLLADADFLEVPKVAKDVRHSWHLYTVLLDADRDRVFDHMRRMNIGVNVHYIPVYRHSFYRTNLRIDPKDYPVTEEVYKRIMTLPLYPRMEEGDVSRVCDALKSFVK